MSALYNAWCNLGMKTQHYIMPGVTQGDVLYSKYENKLCMFRQIPIM